MMKHRPIVEAALKIQELHYQLVDINLVDSKLDYDDYFANLPDIEIIHEAEYRLSCFFEDGHSYHDELNYGYDEEDKKNLRKNMRQLYAFLKKYKPIGQEKMYEYPDNMPKTTTRYKWVAI